MDMLYNGYTTLVESPGIDRLHMLDFWAYNVDSIG